MHHDRNYVISIAGFDPSAGAGILSDVKTFEQLNVYGLGVCSAWTLQTEDAFLKVSWIPTDEIISQLEVLLEKYPVHVLKIGLVESLTQLEEILLFLKNNFPGIKIIWDPILKASAGFAFHPAIDQSRFLNCCREIFLITPNADEVMQLMREPDVLVAAEKLSAITSVFLKSFVNPAGSMWDVLFTGHKKYFLETEILESYRKHGSGCVLSSAIAAFLANGNDLQLSCELAKAYTFQFLKSSPTLLGEHAKIKSVQEHA